MISYDLRCEKGHVFSSYFANMGTYDALREAGLLICVHCDSREIEKAPMAPAIVSGRPSSTPTAADYATFRQQVWEGVEAESTDVGDSFADAVRAGEVPIHGTATIGETIELLAEAYNVMPLPPRPADGASTPVIKKSELN